MGRGRGAGDIFIGANALDYSGYPDCRPEFLEAFERMANLGTRGRRRGRRAFRIQAPLLRIDEGGDRRTRAPSSGSILRSTASCYDPGPTGEPCGACDACLLREKGFREAGSPTPHGAK